MDNQEIQEIEIKKRSLKRYGKSKDCLERLKEKLYILDSKIKSVRSPNLSGMPRGGTPVTVEDMIADKEELENRIETLSLKTRQLKSEILKEIDSLEDERYCDVLESHFIDLLSFETIAENMGYSERYIYTLYKEALVILTKNNNS